ncbi:YesL family protein [Paucisalibacillus globulus]|uniref:YesL family protein n=1 Tax=Paucisalibacillus globulus TaxID=351095 RepID=UPI0003FC3428|nr:YesL family protein [Paucisalibacillus globulus]
MNYTSSKIYSILEWITRLAYVNLLWIFFTILGGIIFGFFPSTIAMFAVTREWLLGKPDIPIFKSFWTHYKSEFIKSNRVGIIIVLITALIGIDFFFIQYVVNESYSWILIPLFSFMLLFILFSFYLFPAFVHYDLKVFPLLKNAFLIMLINPINGFLILVCLVSAYFLVMFIPALLFIFGGSVYAFICMWLSLHTFRKVEQRKADYKATS